MKQPLKPVHVGGVIKGEEYSIRVGKESGRGGRKSYRSARDATSIDPAEREPIDPSMPNIPPA